MTQTESLGTFHLGKTCLQVDDCSIPTMSQWGRAIMILPLLIGGKFYFGKHPQPIRVPNRE